MGKITRKRKKTLKEMINNGGNLTAAVKKTYNCKPENAKQIAYQLRHDKDMAPQLNKILDDLGFTVTDAFQKLIENIRKSDIKTADKYLKLYFTISGNMAESKSKQETEVSQKFNDEELRQIHDELMHQIQLRDRPSTN